MGRACGEQPGVTQPRGRSRDPSAPGRENDKGGTTKTNPSRYLQQTDRPWFLPAGVEGSGPVKGNRLQLHVSTGEVSQIKCGVSKARHKECTVFVFVQSEESSTADR